MISVPLLTDTLIVGSQRINTRSLLALFLVMAVGWALFFALTVHMTSAAIGERVLAAAKYYLKSNDGIALSREINQIQSGVCEIKIEELVPFQTVVFQAESCQSLPDFFKYDRTLALNEIDAMPSNSVAKIKLSLADALFLPSILFIISSVVSTLIWIRSGVLNSKLHKSVLSDLIRLKTSLEFISSDPSKISKVEPLFIYGETIAAWESLKEFDKSLRAIRLESATFEAIARTKQNIAEHIIHDLKSPLDAFERVTTVQSWTDFQSAKTVFSSALFRIHSILNGLRLGELEKVVRPHPSPLSLQELANEISAYANKFGVTIECETPEVPDAYIDHPKVQRVVANLLRNGIECGSNAIRLFCKNSENDLVICVADNGPGVPDDFVPKLFTRGATLGKQNGSGFGLSYAHEVVLGHAGSITHSRHDGWTVFELRFPEALQNTRVAIPQEVVDEQNTAELAPKVFLFLKNNALQMELSALFAEQGIDCSGINSDFSSLGVCIVYGDQELIPEAMFAGKNRILIAHSTDIPSNTIVKIQRILKMHTKGNQT